MNQVCFVGHAKSKRRYTKAYAPLVNGVKHVLKAILGIKIELFSVLTDWLTAHPGLRIKYAKVMK
jgi:hypothetical protein